MSSTHVSENLNSHGNKIVLFWYELLNVIEFEPFLMMFRGYYCNLLKVHL